MRSANRKSLVTMDDVANRASVSQTTVSYVLNGRTTGVNIPTDTRQRVLDAARDLGYRRNQLARAMVTGKSRILGVFTGPAGGEISLKILAGAMEAANQRDYLLKVMHIHYYGIDDSTISRCAEWQIAGAMIVGISEANQQRLDTELREKGFPLVMVDNTPTDTSGVCVVSDDAQGLGLALTHLLLLGHRRIAYVGGRPCGLSERREKIFRSAAQAAGLELPEHWVRNTSWGDQEIIEDGVRTVLTGGPVRPTAIVCSGDNIAMIVLRIAHSLGLRVPEELSVTGYSNAELSPFATPPLTTIDQSFNAMGHAAIEYLIHCDEGLDAKKNSPLSLRGTETRHMQIPTRLVERASTAPAPIL